MLDADNGAGWELLRNMLARNPRDRWSAKEALSSAFLTNKVARAPLFAGELGSTPGAGNSTVSWLLDGLAKSGTTKARGGPEQRGPISCVLPCCVGVVLHRPRLRFPELAHPPAPAPRALGPLQH